MNLGHVVVPWCYVCFIFIPFSYFCFHLSRGPSFNRSLICRRPEYYAPLPFFFCVESTLYVFLPDGVSLSCDHGLGFDTSLCQQAGF